VLFLDSDDVLEPDMLETLVAYLDGHPDVGMAFCDASWIDGDDRPITYGSPGTRYVPSGRGVRPLPADCPDTPFVALFFWGRIGPSVAVLRRSVYEATGGWDEDQGYYAEDLDLWLKVSLRNTVHFVPRRLVRRRIHGENNGLRADSRAAERRLYRRWLNASWLTAEERRLVTDAWRLRQRRFLPYLWRKWGTDNLRRGHLGQAAICYLRSLKRLATYAAARARRELPAGPVW
jgi:GT2 family glycosyltransferase